MRLIFYVVALVLFLMAAFQWTLPFLQGVGYQPLGLAALTLALWGPSASRAA